MTALRVLRPGLFTTIQDSGRRGFARWGVPRSGFADPFSAAVANRLVGNRPETALLEAALGGIELVALRAVALGVAGATADVSVDGVPVDRSRTVAVRAGQRIAVGPASRGLRVYVAVSGGIAVAPLLGSRSAFLSPAFEGVLGRRLAAGDELSAGDSPIPEPRVLSAAALLPFPTDEIRAMAGPQRELFGEAAARAFFGSPFRISSRSDRRGLRLEGEPVPPSDGEIAPEGVVVGSVQVPAGGEPIVLMPDGPVTGGYPKIAVAVAADLPVLGQLRPGDTVRFREVSREEALSAWAARRAELDGAWPE